MRFNPYLNSFVPDDSDVDGDDDDDDDDDEGILVQVIS